MAGDFKQRDSVTYANELALNLPTGDDDGDVGAQAEARESEGGNRAAAAPTIRKKGDQAGSSAVNPNRQVPKAVPVRRANFLQRLFKR